MKDKACPFCGSDKIRRSEMQFMQAVGCESCGAAMIGGDWNKRTAVADSKITEPSRIGCFTFMPGTPADVVLAAAARQHVQNEIEPDEAEEADARVQLAHFKVMVSHVLDEFATEYNKRSGKITDFHVESSALRGIIGILFTPGDPGDRIRQAQSVVVQARRQLGR